MDTDTANTFFGAPIRIIEETSMLGTLETAVLRALTRTQPDAYGLSIHKEVVNIYKNIKLGSVYATLHRLEKKEYISSEESMPNPYRGGRRKKLYKIERIGLNALRQTELHFKKSAEDISVDISSRLCAECKFC